MPLMTPPDRPDIRPGTRPGHPPGTPPGTPPGQGATDEGATDEGLAAAAAAGDERAFRALVDRYAGPVLGLCRGWVRDPHLAEDCAQETLIKLHQSVSTFRQDRVFKAWLFRIARNTCIDRLRREKAGVDTQALTEEALPDPRPAPPLAGGQTDALRAAIDELPERQRALLHCRYQLGLNAVQCATLLGISHANARVGLHRAIKTLRARLAP